MNNDLISGQPNKWSMYNKKVLGVKEALLLKKLE